MSLSTRSIPTGPGSRGGHWHEREARQAPEGLDFDALMGAIHKVLPPAWRSYPEGWTDADRASIQAEYLRLAASAPAAGEDSDAG